MTSATRRHGRTAVAWALAVGGVVVVASAMPWLSGDDPALRIFRARFGERPATPQALDAIREDLDLAANPIEGAVGWLVGLTHGDLGTSWVSGRAFGSTIKDAWLVSLSLAGVATLVSLGLAILLVGPGLLRVARGLDAGSPRATAVFAVLASIPTMVLAIALIALVAVRGRLLPALGWQDPIDAILPTVALDLPMSGILARVLTSAIRTTASEEWLFTWQANGFRPQ